VAGTAAAAGEITGAEKSPKSPKSPKSFDDAAGVGAKAGGACATETGFGAVAAVVPEKATGSFFVSNSTMKGGKKSFFGTGGGAVVVPDISVINVGVKSFVAGIGRGLFCDSTAASGKVAWVTGCCGAAKNAEEEGSGSEAKEAEGAVWAGAKDT